MSQIRRVRIKGGHHPEKTWVSDMMIPAGDTESPSAIPPAMDWLRYIVVLECMEIFLGQS